MSAYVRVICPSCGDHTNLPESYSGRVTCGHCASGFTIDENGDTERTPVPAYVVWAGVLVVCVLAGVWAAWGVVSHQRAVAARARPEPPSPVVARVEPVRKPAPVEKKIFLPPSEQMIAQKVKEEVDRLRREIEQQKWDEEDREAKLAADRAEQKQRDDAIRAEKLKKDAVELRKMERSRLSGEAEERLNGLLKRLNRPGTYDEYNGVKSSLDTLEHIHSNLARGRLTAASIRTIIRGYDKELFWSSIPLILKVAGDLRPSLDDVSHDITLQEAFDEFKRRVNR